MHNLLYGLSALLACGYLAFANARGYSPLSLIMPSRLGSGGGSSLHHK